MGRGEAEICTTQVMMTPEVSMVVVVVVVVVVITAGCLIACPI